jgi:hypothetical protein
MSHGRRPSISQHPTAGTMLDETLPLIGAIPLYGPPVVCFAGPWILFALLLTGPFALLMTIVIALLAAGGLIVAIAATPYLLVRCLRAAWAHHSAARARVRPLPANPPATADLALSPKSAVATTT